MALLRPFSGAAALLVFSAVTANCQVIGFHEHLYKLSGPFPCVSINYYQTLSSSSEAVLPIDLDCDGVLFKAVVRVTLPAEVEVVGSGEAIKPIYPTISVSEISWKTSADDKATRLTAEASVQFTNFKPGGESCRKTTELSGDATKLTGAASGTCMVDDLESTGIESKFEFEGRRKKGDTDLGKLIGVTATFHSFYRYRESGQPVITSITPGVAGNHPDEAYNGSSPAKPLEVTIRGTLLPEKFSLSFGGAKVLSKQRVSDKEIKATVAGFESSPDGPLEVKITNDATGQQTTSYDRFYVTSIHATKLEVNQSIPLECLPSAPCLAEHPTVIRAKLICTGNLTDGKPCATGKQQVRGTLRTYSNKTIVPGASLLPYLTMDIMSPDEPADLKVKTIREVNGRDGLDFYFTDWKPLPAGKYDFTVEINPRNPAQAPMGEDVDESRNLVLRMTDKVFANSDLPARHIRPNQATGWMDIAVMADSDDPKPESRDRFLYYYFKFVRAVYPVNADYLRVSFLETPFRFDKPASDNAENKIAGRMQEMLSGMQAAGSPVTHLLLFSSRLKSNGLGMCGDPSAWRCNGRTVLIKTLGDDTAGVIAHELGHNFDLGDTYINDDGSLGTVNNQINPMSACHSTPNGCVIEAGNMDMIANGTALDVPDDSALVDRVRKYDFMGNAGRAGRWTDRRTWNHLYTRFNSFTATKTNSARERSSEGDIERIAVNVQVGADGSGSFGSFFRSRGEPVEDGDASGPYSVAILDASGSVLASRLFSVVFQVSGQAAASDTAYTTVILPFPAGAATISLRNGETEIDSRKVSPNAPEVQLVSPAGGGALEGKVTVSWTASDADGDTLTYSLYYSRDDGKTWLPLAMQLETGAYEWNTEASPGSQAVRLMAVASDGVNQGVAISDSSFMLASKKPFLSIIQPADGAVLDPNEPVLLEVSVYDPQKGVLPGERISFASDKDGELGTGGSLAVERLSAGVHILTATATNDDGLSESASITVTVSDGSQTPGIESLSPDRGAVGTTVTINGVNFSPNGVENSVKFGSAEATVESATETQIKTTVPELLAPGGVPVTVKVGGLTSAPADFVVLGSVLELTPGTLDFGKVPVGQSFELDVNARNTGNDPLSVETLSFSNERFSLVSPVLPFTIDPGGLQVIRLRFTPAETGEQSGTLSIGTGKVTLTGIGEPPSEAILSVNPVALDFGKVAVGQTKDLELIATNTGTAALAVQQVNISNARFSLVSPAVPFSIAAGGRQTMVVRFTPAAAGDQAALLTIATAKVPLIGAGEGSGPKLALSPSPLDFGTVTIGDTKVLALTLRNDGAASLTVSAAVATGAFTVTSTVPFSVGPGGQQAVLVRFAPDVLGSASGTLTLTSNDPSQPSATVPLSGTGQAGAGTPAGLVGWWRFEEASGTAIADSSGNGNGGTLAGNASWTQGRIGSSALRFNGNSGITGSGPGTNFPSGGSARTITAWIQAPGATSDTSILHYGTVGGAPGANFHLFLAGTGRAGFGNGYLFGTVESTNRVDDGNWHFLAGVYEGSSTNNALIYVDGVLQTQGKLSTVTATGTSSNWKIARFLDGQGGFNGAMDDVRLYANALTATEIRTTFTEAGGVIPIAVPQIEVSPSALDFGSVTSGQTKDLSLTVRNTGTADLSVNPASVSGAGFSLVSASTFIVGAGGQQSVVVRFAPAAAASYTGQLKLTTNDPAHATVTVNLSGTGTTPAPPPVSITRTLVYHEITSFTKGTLPYNVGPHVLSANGNRISYTSTASDGSIHVWVIDPSGSGMKEIDSYLPKCNCDGWPDISADGSRVASSDGMQIRVVNADGTGRTTVASDREAFAFRLAPAGDKVFFLNRRGEPSSSDATTERGLYVVNTNGTGMRQIVGPKAVMALLGLSQSQASYFGAAGRALDVSADGTRVVFGVNTGGEDRVFAVNSDGSGLRLLLGPYDYVRHVAISGNGNKVGYDVIAPPCCSSPNEIGVINWDGTGKRVLAANTAGSPGDNILDRHLLTSDGSQLLAGGTGKLYKTDGSGVVQLAVRASSDEGLVWDEMKWATMNNQATRFSYAARDNSLILQLATLDLGSASSGAAPVLTEPGLTQDWVTINWGARTTISARVTSPSPLKKVTANVFLKGLPDSNVYSVPMFDDGRYGDVRPGDGTYTSDQLGANYYAETGARTVRIKAETTDSSNRRHATAIDFGGLEVLATPR